MSKGEYAKYVFEGLTPPSYRIPELEGYTINPFIWSNEWFPGSQLWVELQLVHKAGGAFGAGADVIATEGEKAGQVLFTLGVHHHVQDEAFFFFGTNIEDPYSLGGEYEFWLGAGGDAEQFILTKNTCIYVPGGLDHNPHRATRIDNPAHPIVLLAILISPHHGPGSTFHLTDAAGKPFLPPGWKIEKR